MIELAVYALRALLGGSKKPWKDKHGPKEYHNLGGVIGITNKMDVPQYSPPARVRTPTSPTKQISREIQPYQRRGTTSFAQYNAKPVTSVKPVRWV